MDLLSTLATANKELLPIETKRLKVEDGDVDNIDKHLVWTRFGKAQLSKLDLKEIRAGGRYSQLVGINTKA